MIDNAKITTETKEYKTIPIITDFSDETKTDRMKEQIQRNYNRIKEETKQIVANELDRIKNDPELAYLLQQER